MKKATLFATVLALALTVLTAPAAQAQFSVIHNFTNGNDGSNPYGGLTIDGAGNLYGTASAGGSGGNGTVYKMSLKNSNWILSTMYSFQNGADGNTPTAGVIRGNNGVLYGATFSGGAYGAGTVFQLAPAPAAGAAAVTPWVETILYSFTGSFTGGGDGGYPDMLGGYLAMDQSGDLYGTTLYGGDANCQDGNPTCGTVFKLIPGNGGWKESVLYAFTGGNDGGTPYGGVALDAQGDIYGLTFSGGYQNSGTAFQLNPSGSEKFVVSFCSPYGCTYGTNPTGGPVFDNSGNLYFALWGAAFEIPDAQNGFGNLDSDTIYPNLCCYPNGNPILDAKGNVYGTDTFGGASGYGNVFKLTPGNPYWTYTSLHDFTGGTDGGYPYGTLVFDAQGNLYGTASQGGTGAACQGDCGVVFQIKP